MADPLDRKLALVDSSRYDLTRAISRERELPKQSCGSFAKIIIGKHETLGKVAVKVLNRRYPSNDDVLRKDIARELGNWLRLGAHDNILPLEGLYWHGEFPAFVTKWVEEGSLWDYIQSGKTDCIESMSMICGIASGLAHMHRNRVIHSDMKSDNILITSQLRPLLTDFGCSRFSDASIGYSTDMTVSSIPWKAKELILSETPTEQTDIWAFGMTIYELLAHDRPYYSIDTQLLADHIVYGNLPAVPTFTEGEGFALEEYIWSLCNNCWGNPELRPSMELIESETRKKYAESLIAVGNGTGGGSEMVENRIVGRSTTSTTHEDRSAISWKKQLRDLLIEDLSGTVLLLNEVKSNNLDHRQPPVRAAHGGSADVFRGSYLSIQGSGEFLAIKVIDPRSDAKREKRLIDEIRMWSQFGSEHPNISPLLGCAFFEEYDWNFPTMVSKWESPLKDLLRGYKRSTAISVALGIAKGMRFLHSKGITHGDIKSENVVVTPESNPLLIDFGIASSDSIGSGSNVGRGTKRWMAPELFPVYLRTAKDGDDLELERAASSPTQGSDIWAFGMTELLSRQIPYFERSPIFLERWITKGELPSKPICLVSEYPPGPEHVLETLLWDVCCCCFEINVDMRPRASSLVEKIEQMSIHVVDAGSNNPGNPHHLADISPVDLLREFLTQNLPPNLTEILFLVSKVHSGSSEVFKAQTTSRNMFEFAVKRLPIKIADRKSAKVFAGEIRSWAYLNHINVMQISGYCVVGGEPCPVTKWREGRSLHDCLKNINRRDAFVMVAGIARGLEYVHSQGYVHSNIKASNILISDDKQAQLTDFGSMRILSAFNTEATEGVSLENTRWRAYEMFSSELTAYTKETDVWAFGMAIYEVLARNVPYYYIHRDNIANTISEGSLPRELIYSQDSDDARIEMFMWNWCYTCWNSDPDKRPSVTKLKNKIMEFADTDTDTESLFVPIITIEDEEGKLLREPDDFVYRASSAEVLARVLNSRRDLDLTGRIFVDPHAARTKHGGAADIFEGYIIETKEKVAVKRLRLNIGGSEKIAKDIAREIRVWSEFVHPNILPILGYCVEGDYPSLISKWIIRGSVKNYMVTLDKKETVAMILGIARGMAYIHSRKAIHSDLKTDNVLVSEEKNALLTDFGVSRMDALSDGFTTHSVKGSTRWQAMEFFEIPEDESPAPTHTVQTDIWAFGMTVYELLTHKLPYHHVGDNTQVVNYISRGRLPEQPETMGEGIDGEINRYLWSICERCWIRDPYLRPTMAEWESEIYNFSKTI